MKALENYFAGIKKCAVAFSGGADSSLVLKIAADSLGTDNVIAVTGVSETYPRSDLKSAVETAKKIGVKHVLLHTYELRNRDFSKNPPSRCFYCKSELFGRIKKIASQQGISVIVDGSNYDDLSDFRPGREAAKRFGVRSPLVEKRVTKAGVRRISRALGLATWNRPQSPCLASRVPYGTQIAPQILKKIDSAENILRKSGFTNLRVRHYGETARIEVDKRDIPRLIKTLNPATVAKIKSLGYKYVTVDAEGFRSGSLSE